MSGNLSVLLDRGLRACPACGEVIVVERWRSYVRTRLGYLSEFGRPLASAEYDLTERHGCDPKLQVKP